MSLTSQTYKIKENFKLEELADFIQQTYTIKGYNVVTNRNTNSIQITISKNVGGIHIITGLVEQATINLVTKDDQLNCMINSEAFGSDKIGAIVVGFFCFWITWVTAAIGFYNQSQLPTNINAMISTYVFSL